MLINYHLQKKLIIDVSKSEPWWAHSQGYVWFHKVFIPALEKVASLSLLPNETVSECYYKAGDAAEFNNAPKKALEYYYTALSFDPDCGATCREIANMLDRLGRFDEALEYIDRAIALNLDDTLAVDDREYILENTIAGGALYEHGDVLWDVCELLANAAPTKALAMVKDMTGVIGLRGKQYCYGALNEADKYLETWSELTQLSDKMDINSADWFYMPEYIFDSPDIWTILLSSQTEFSGCGTVFDSLENSGAYRALTINDGMRLSFQYHKFTTSKNHKALKELSETYPEWVELREHFPPNH